MQGGAPTLAARVAPPRSLAAGPRRNKPLSNVFCGLIFRSSNSARVNGSMPSSRIVPWIRKAAEAVARHHQRTEEPRQVDDLSRVRAAAPRRSLPGSIRRPVRGSPMPASSRGWRRRASPATRPWPANGGVTCAASPARKQRPFENAAASRAWKRYTAVRSIRMRDASHQGASRRRTFRADSICFARLARAQHELPALPSARRGHARRRAARVAAELDVVDRVRHIERVDDQPVLREGRGPGNPARACAARASSRRRRRPGSGHALRSACRRGPSAAP